MTPTTASRLVPRPASRPSRPDASEEAAPSRTAGFGPLAEPALFYDPPYATPLEDAVAWHLVKYLDDAHALDNRVALPRSTGAVGHVDFCIETPDRRVALQFLGYAGDDPDAPARCRRDAQLVAEGHVDALYRVRRADLAHRLPDVLLVLARWEPALFSPRGRTNLTTLATPAVRAWNPAPGTFHAALDLPAGATHALLDTDLPIFSTLHIDRLSRVHPDSWRNSEGGVRRTESTLVRAGKG